MGESPRSQLGRPNGPRSADSTTYSEWYNRVYANSYIGGPTENGAHYPNVTPGKYSLTFLTIIVFKTTNGYIFISFQETQFKV